MASKLLYDDLENCFFPELLQEMYRLVKEENVLLADLDIKYGERLTRLISTRKYQYDFLEYIKWGGEALLLKLKEKTGTGRTVAAKIANPFFNLPGKRDVWQETANPKEYEERQINSFRDRFIRGMTAQQQLEDSVAFSHGSIPKIFEISQKPLYFVMQFVNGTDFDIWVTQADLSDRLDFFEKLLRFMGEIHTRGFFHRDLKPNNILVRQKKPCLVDFTTTKHIDDGDNITVYQMGIGHRLYAAPETLHDIREADWRSDIYSLGKMLEMLWTQKPPTLDGKTLPKPFYRVYQRSTQYNKNDRYQFVSEFFKQFLEAKNTLTLKTSVDSDVLSFQDLLKNCPTLKKIAIPMFKAIKKIKETDE